jgi:hypothetical protein
MAHQAQLCFLPDEGEISHRREGTRTKASCYTNNYDDMSQLLASKLRTLALTQTSFLNLVIRAS